MQKFVTTGATQNSTRASKTGGRRHSDIQKHEAKKHRHSNRRSGSKDSSNDDNNNANVSLDQERKLENGGYEVARFPGPPLPPPNTVTQRFSREPEHHHHHPRQQTEDVPDGAQPAGNAHVLKIAVVDHDQQQSTKSPESEESEPPPAPPRIESYHPTLSRQKKPDRKGHDHIQQPCSSRMFDLSEHEAMKRTLEENYAQDNFGRSFEQTRSSIRETNQSSSRKPESTNQRTITAEITNHHNPTVLSNRLTNHDHHNPTVLSNGLSNHDHHNRTVLSNGLTNQRLISSEIANQRAISSELTNQRRVAAELANQQALSSYQRMVPVQNSESDSQIMEKLKQETGAKLRVVELRAESVNNLDSENDLLHSAQGTSMPTVHARSTSIEEPSSPSNLNPTTSNQSYQVTRNSKLNSSNRQPYYRTEEPIGRLENIPNSKKAIPKSGQHHFHPQNLHIPNRNIYSEATTSGYEAAYASEVGQLNSSLRGEAHRPALVHNHIHKHGRNEVFPSRESTENYSWTTGGSQQTFPVSDIESNGQRMRRTRSGDIIADRGKDPERSKFDERFMKKSASARYHPNSRIVMVPPSERRHLSANHKRPTRHRNRGGKRNSTNTKRRTNFWDFSTHKWILMGVVGAFLIWAAIFFPILMAANEHEDLN